VILHPKLQDAGQYASIFPKLSALEPDLTDLQRKKILGTIADSINSFEVQVYTLV